MAVVAALLIENQFVMWVEIVLKLTLLAEHDFIEYEYSFSLLLGGDRREVSNILTDAIIPRPPEMHRSEEGGSSHALFRLGVIVSASFAWQSKESLRPEFSPNVGSRGAAMACRGCCSGCYNSKSGTSAGVGWCSDQSDAVSFHEKTARHLAAFPRE